jgi:4-amino-4-deoxy-L-arabinose transferase-like glycosyltransferase
LSHRSRVNRFWVGFTLVAVFGGIIFVFLFLMPYDLQVRWLGSLSADGSVESFTFRIYYLTKFCLGPLALVFLAGAVFLIGFKSRSASVIESIYGSTKRFIQGSRKETGELFRAIIPSKSDLLPLLILLGIVFLGIFFRYAYLWRPMGHDETYTFMAFASRGLRAVITDYHLPNNHVFHTILVSLFYQLFGDSPAVIRLPALIAGILVIPATYLIGRIFYSSKIGLVGASTVAALPVLIDYSTTARGYPIITLFALIIVALAAYAKGHRNLIAWGILVLIASLGMYTNPTMIYPIGMAFTWLFLSKLINDVDQEYGSKYYLYLGGSIVFILVLSGVFYLPIVYSSGLSSFIGNDVIEGLSWPEFAQSVLPRIRNTWMEWNRDLPGFVSIFALVGLVASFFVPKLPRNRRVPLILAGFLWIASALVLQRVAPWPRIWIFLLPFFIIWISAGVIGLCELLLKTSKHQDKLLGVLVGLLVTIPLVLGLLRTYPQFDQKLHAKGAVEEVADFLNQNLGSKDVVVVTSPDTIVLKYYLRRLGISKEATELTKGKDFQRALVVVNRGYGQTLAYVLEKRSFLDDVDLNSAEEIYNSNRFSLYELEGRHN